MIQPPEFIVQHLRDGRCLLFVGSGLSSAAGMPGWADLLLEIAAKAERTQPDRIDLAEIRRALTEKKLYLEVAEDLEASIGKPEMHAAMAQELRRDVDLAEAHELLPRLPFRAIVTTNFDQLIERAFDHGLRVVTQCDHEGLADCIARDDPFLLKAHGDVDAPDTIVLTESDFMRIVHESPAFQLAFSSLLLRNAVLFVGYSIDDPDFRRLFERQVALFGNSGLPRFALIRGLGKTEIRSLGRKKIQVIPYDDHEEVPRFLHALLDALTRRPAVTKSRPTSAFGGMMTARGQALDRKTVLRQYRAGDAQQVELLLLNDHPLIADPLRDELGEREYSRLRAEAITGARERARAQRDSVVVLPGFMGSQLQKPSGAVVWVNFLRLLSGGFCKLALDGSSAGPEITAAAAHSTYLKSSLHLDQKWSGRMFPYDWRQDMFAVADDLRGTIEAATDSGGVCHLVAHGSGGLVARAFVQRHPDVWARAGGRLVMLGTPNHGWFASILLLLGLESLQRRLATLDLRSTLEQVRRVFSSFPSVYQTLPSPLLNPTWQVLYDAASYSGKSVSQELLERGCDFHETIAPAVDPDRMVNILGQGTETVSDVENAVDLGAGGRFAMSLDGDGRTAIALGELESVPTYFVDEDHGSLPQNDDVLAAVDDILRTGRTERLSSHRRLPVSR